MNDIVSTKIKKDKPLDPAPPALPISSLSRLLGKLRVIMATLDNTESALQKIVQLVAKELNADVCSCYVLRAGEVLELFATIGLKKSAIHKTRLRVGEGIVGSIAASAQPMATDNAPDHPNFAYRPETGEDPYLGFCGVPILRGNKLRGVFVIQHKDAHHYSSHDIEQLETVSMLLAELISTGQLLSRDEVTSTGDPNLQTARLVGISLNTGLALGAAVLHKPEIIVHTIIAEDSKAELQRLDDALTTMHFALDEMIAATKATGRTEHFDILETYRMFAADRGWLNRIREKIEQGLTAEAAVQAVQQDTQNRLAQINDPYLKARAQDFDDLARRLIGHLSGQAQQHDNLHLPDDSILVARTMGPADFLEYDHEKIKAIVLADGSPSSHVAIMARAMGVPVIGQCPDAFHLIENGDALIVDGDQGAVLIRPSDDIIETCRKSLLLRAQQRAAQWQETLQPAITLDGVAISVMINAGLVNDLPDMTTNAVNGVGLYRTEIPFMMQNRLPDVDTQYSWYRNALLKSHHKPIIFRTLDVGSDKELPYLPAMKEENPALGWRGARIGLDRPAMLRTQLRALVRAGSDYDLWIMFPLVSEVSELQKLRSLVRMELLRAEKDKYEPPRSVKIGVMVEVPSLLFQLPALMPLVDFISVGSNDLMQYMFAADRANTAVWSQFDPLTPAFLRALRTLAVAANQHNVTISLCGEMAGRPLESLALIGLGYRSLSMSQHAIAGVKSMIRGLHAQTISRYLNFALDGPSVDTLRPQLRAFARDHGILLDTAPIPQPENSSYF